MDFPIHEAHYFITDSCKMNCQFYDCTIISFYAEAILIGVSAALAAVVLANIVLVVIIGVMCMSKRAQKSVSYTVNKKDDFSYDC